VQARLKPALHAVVTSLDMLRRTGPDAEIAWRERDQARLDRCTAVIRRLSAEGTLAEDWSIPDAAYLMWAATSQRVWEDLVLEGGMTSDQYRTHLTRLLERALT